MAKHITRNVLTIFAAALVVPLAGMTLGNNEIYQLGVGFGETLREGEDGSIMDLSELDYELQQLGEQFGDTPMAEKLLSNDFVEGATYGYYKSEILGQ